MKEILYYKKGGTMKNQRLVWYISYGSNMLLRRFAFYVLGGKLKGTEKVYKGCTDKSLPKQSIACQLKYDVYFGQQSSTWGGGVAFLDTSKVGHAYARAYLITYEQMLEIHTQEGKGKEWYKDLIEVGDINGKPAYIITNKIKRKANAPTKEYLKVIAKGLKETYPSMPKKKRNAYIEKIVANV